VSEAGAEVLDYSPRRVPRPAVTVVLIAANVAVFLYMVSRGGIESPHAERVFEAGALETHAVRSGEWWRLATATFLHAGWVHLLVNMYSLWAVGPLVERLFGAWPYAVLYAFSGWLASVTSLHAHAHAPDFVGVGASGAIFGIVGGLAAYLVRLGRFVFGPGATTAMLKNLAVVVGINVVYGLSAPRIDNAAHGGGLVAGIVLGWALAGAPKREAQARRGARTALVALGAALALAGGLAWFLRR
jgi:rhomboid protease GluP